MTLAMVVALALLCGAWALEKWTLRKCRRSFDVVIHVNGIRGKTSTCRMLDAVLRQQYRVLTKTTGTEPRILHVDGRDTPLRRWGPANVMEQARTLRRARREGARVVILECMAVAPALQRISEKQILRADIAVITNVRYDHIFEMGETLEAIAAALAGVIPTGGTLYTGDADFYPYFVQRSEEMGSRAVCCAAETPGGENEAIVRAIAHALGMDDSAIDTGLAGVRPDLGMRARYRTRNAAGEPIDFLNLFAANDPLSARMHVDALAGQYQDIRFVYNNRQDRPDRVLLFARHFFPAYPGARVTVLGEARPLACRLLRRVPALEIRAARGHEACLDVPAGTLLVGLGNTKGEAKRMLARLNREAEGE